MSKSIVRSMKNATKGYSHVQVNGRNATSNDSWGPSGTEMSEIAQATFNSQADFQDIMEILDKRLNDKGKNWRHVLKSLKVLDYCLHEGTEHVVTWARNNIYIIKTLREFQYIDEEGRDVGLNVRTSAKELTSLILDEDRLRAERKDRKNWKSRVTGLDEFGPTAGYAGGAEPSRPPKERRHVRVDDGDLEYRLAIEASKNQEEEDRKRRESKHVSSGPEDVDDDLKKALRLSEEEEELRRKQIEEKNAQSLLFDDTPAQQPQATGWNQGYQQQSAVDWFGNPVDQQQQQPQSTGYLNNAYQQPQSIGIQHTLGYNPYQQPQQTGYDQALYQQTQQSYLQPQQTSFNMNNPYSQQQQPQQQQPQPQVQQQHTLQSGSHNPWATNSTDDTLKPQPTGSNNPFASSFMRPTSTPAKQAPTLTSLQEQRTQTQFNQPFAPAQQQNPQHAHLNALLAAGEGQDTFGNVGNMRIPAQHTAPGNFINSAGGGMRMQPAQTGTNPFLSSQYTGLPPPVQQQQQQQQQMYPAQTGPVGGGYGTGFGGSTNPFGAPRHAQGGQGQGGSLIDL